ncbi:uncharacterized protein BDZ83DRAFT_755775 [Colletotrichum acutatum]|uniref:Uncharacterized protein n=1 Tax=Glomerella acutata TaxID=27357 RepID=A0AAD8UGG4_GLOAC|nr:uncharacterized protein BDZ83DRAFT_755775 [Colletotrichum acutatum]KAK1717402.1 hypothetical protein BDZ83DRAFT_755775 [Colletotrichum acutatum]
MKRWHSSNIMDNSFDNFESQDDMADNSIDDNGNEDDPLPAKGKDFVSQSHQNSAVNDTSYNQPPSDTSADKVTALLMLESRVAQMEETCNQLKKDMTRFQLKTNAVYYHRMAMSRVSSVEGRQMRTERNVERIDEGRQQTEATQQQVQVTQAAQDKHIQYLIACEDARDASKHGSNASEDEHYQRHKELQDRCDELTMKNMRYDEIFISQATRNQRMDALGQNLAICTVLIVVVIAIVGYAVFSSWD